MNYKCIVCGRIFEDYEIDDEMVIHENKHREDGEIVTGFRESLELPKEDESSKEDNDSNKIKRMKNYE